MNLSKNNPQASVILPIFNGEKYLSKTIDSVLGQSFGDFEVLLLNDGSRDNSLEIVNMYADIDNRCKVYSWDNKGVVWTTNKGLELALGDIIFLIDQDDVCAPERFEKQIKYLENNRNCVAVGSGVTFIDPEGLPIMPVSVPLDQKSRYKKIMNCDGIAIANPSVAIRRKALIDIGGYRQEYLYAQDIDVFLRLAEIGKLANIDAPLLFYRQHLEMNSIKNIEIQRISAQRAINAEAARRGVGVPDFEEKMETLDMSLIDIYIKWAWWSIGANNFKTAKKYALKSLYEKPFSMEVVKLWYCLLCKN